MIWTGSRTASRGTSRRWITSTYAAAWRPRPLIPLEGDDAWVYLHLRDVLVDAHQASLAGKDGKEPEKPSFIAGDLRQCLSSYEQLAESAILAKKLPRAEATMSLVQHLRRDGHVHPKIAALCDIVGRILDREIAALRARPAAGFPKILVFNTLMHTAGALKEALTRTVEERVDPFVEEQVRAAGWASLDEAREMIREALRQEREEVREQLAAEFEARFLLITRDLLEGTGLEMKAESRAIVDVMFDRAENHCTQPLFLLRMALWLRATGEQADAFGVQTFLMRHIGDPLRKYGRQAGDDREMRRENFNRPYAPLVLLVSRVGEEGIDLQQHTRYILHYDVEWNPAKMEQREGRVDREGRKTQGAVQVQFFLLKDTYEERIFHTVMQRDAWFQVLIGSKKQELARGIEDDPEEAGDSVVGEESGRLTAEERAKVMIDLRP